VILLSCSGLALPRRPRPPCALLTQCKGTHLPDLTVVTPVFSPDDDTQILFYVASRGHHTDM
jgi:5-oxoprolinase (ATP-hydrolysing)